MENQQLRPSRPTGAASPGVRQHWCGLPRHQFARPALLVASDISYVPLKIGMMFLSGCSYFWRIDGSHQFWWSEELTKRWVDLVWLCRLTWSSTQRTQRWAYHWVGIEDYLPWFVSMDVEKSWNIRFLIFFDSMGIGGFPTICLLVSDISRYKLL